MKCRSFLFTILSLSSSIAVFGQGTPGTFTFTGSMSVQREQASATLIAGCNCPADGKVLIVGGVINFGTFTTNTAELYDPATGQFTLTGSMNVARSGQAAALLPGGKVLFVGAFNSPPGIDAEIYDPVGGMFSCVAGVNLSTGLCNATLINNSPALTATTLQSGKVLITGLQTPTSGSQASTAAAIYDPIQATFTCVSGLSFTPGVCNPSMNNPHISGTATLLGNGTVLIAGGFDRNVGDTNLAEIYDPTVGPNGAFSATGSLLTTRANHAAVLLKTGEVLIVGGGNETGNFNTAEVFANGSFSAVGNMAHVRLYPTATLLNDGTALIAGGCCEVSNQQLPYAEIYNPTAKSFGSTGNMNNARAQHTALLLPTGQVLVAGGFFDATAELYTPVPPDMITSISPTSGTQGQTITSFTVSGTNFDANATLLFSGVGITVNSYASRTTTQIIASITIASTAAIGLRDVIVVNSAGQQAILAVAFAVLGVPVTRTLTVSSTNPANGVPVTASPSDNTGLTSGNTPLTLTYNDSAIVTLTAAPTAGGNTFSNWTGPCASASGMSCTVTMTGDRAVTANYVTPPPPPTITSITPSFGIEGQTISNFTVNGANFLPMSVLSFSGSSSDFTISYVSRTGTQIVANVAIASNATVSIRDVSVSTQGAVPVTLPSAFRVAEEFRIFSRPASVLGVPLKGVSEPSLAADPDPNRPLHAVVGFNDPDFTGCHWAETRDGQHWDADGSFPFPSGFAFSSDPWLKYSSDGKLFFACLGTTSFSGLNPFSQTRTTEVFLAESDTGFAQDLKLKPRSTTMTSTQTCNRGLLQLLSLASCQNLATGEYLDHPSFGLLRKPDGNFRVVMCWVDFFSPGRNTINAAFLDNNSWSPVTTLAKGQVSSCTVGGSESQIAITWARSTVVNSANQYVIELVSSADGQNWSSFKSIASEGSLVVGSSDVSTTSIVLSAPYALAIPGQNGLRAVWQARDTSLPIGQVYVRDVSPNLGNGSVFGGPGVEKFIPGAGSCGGIGGAYMVTSASTHFRYSVWSLLGANPVGPIFTSGADLDPQYGKDDPNHPGFKRIGDYTSVDCSGKLGWASWTDLREQRMEIWGAIFPLTN